MTPLDERIQQVISTLNKEDVLLQGVVKRLFSAKQRDVTWLQNTLNTPEGIDRLESFTSKFCRMQDTFMDKLVPLYLRQAGELPTTAIDNLHRMEQLDLVEHADDWVDMRHLRNKLVHEYVDDIKVLYEHVMLAKSLADELHKSFHKLAAQLGKT